MFGDQFRKKSIAMALLGVFTVTGTYNAVVINSESELDGSNVKLVKRLDEVYGVVKSGRQVAASVQWQKIAPEAKSVKLHKVAALPRVQKQEVASPSVESEAVTEAAVQEDLNLQLVEVINARKWQQGLASDQFYGNLETSHGIIDSLNVALPNGEGVSVSFSEMTGNVFEYDLNGELYSGMMYQVDEKSYMVTLTNGPLEGTRLKFAAAPSYEEQQAQEYQAYLAQGAAVETGNFGSNQEVEAQAEKMFAPDSHMTDAEMQAQGYNFHKSQKM